MFEHKSVWDVGLRIHGMDLENVKQIKFLGMWLDERLTWKAHIEKFCVNSGRIIKDLQCLAGSDWGASTEELLMIYRTSIRFILDYGCASYGTDASFVLKKLDVIQSKALRVCSGAFITTPISALLVEMGELLLSLRRCKLGLQYLMKIRGQAETDPVKSLWSQY